MNPDFRDILELLIQEKVEFLIVGAHALAVHGVARATGDIDIFVNPNFENSTRIFNALGAFGAPLQAHGIHSKTFSKKGVIYQMGLPPHRIDILSAIDGVEFSQAWRGRVLKKTAGLSLPFLGRKDLIQNKKMAARPKDLADIALLVATDDAE